MTFIAIVYIIGGAILLLKSQTTSNIWVVVWAFYAADMAFRCLPN